MNAKAAKKLPPCEPPHYGLIRFIAILTASTTLLGIVLWTNASDFNKTEWTAIGQWVGGIVTAKAGQAALWKIMNW